MSLKGRLLKLVERVKKLRKQPEEEEKEPEPNEEPKPSE